MERTNKQYALIIGVVVTAIVVMLVFAGCTTANKVTRFTDKDKNKKFTQQLAQDIFDRSDSLSAYYCASKHPCKDSTYTETIYLPGKKIIDTQWLPYNCDSAIKAGVKVVKIPIYRTLSVDTEKILEKVYQTDKAKLEQLKYECAAKLKVKEGEINELKASNIVISNRLKGEESKVNIRSKWAWAGWIIIALFISLQILRSYLKF